MFLQKLLLFSTNTFVGRHSQRLYATTKPIKELYKVIGPKAFIKINSIWNLRIRPYDLLDCQDGNLLRASLVPIGTTIDKLGIDANAFELDIVGISNRISIQAGFGDNDVDDVIASATALDNVMCILEVPVKSNLTVRCEQGVDIQNMGGLMVDIECNGNIRTKNMQQACMLTLESKSGSIECEGNTLTEDMQLRVYGDNVSLINEIHLFDIILMISLYHIFHMNRISALTKRKAIAWKQFVKQAPSPPKHAMWNNRNFWPFKVICI